MGKMGLGFKFQIQMEMGMKSLKWEGFGTKKSVPTLSLAPVNPDWFYLPGFTFLVPAHPGSPRQNPEEP